MGKYLQIKEIGKVITGKTPSTEDASNFDGKYPFITPSDIKSFDEKYLLETERTLSEKGIKKLKNNILPKEAICFVCIGSTIGKMCLTNTIAYSNQQINSLIVNNNFDAHYMFYFLRYIKSYFQQLGAGTGSGKGIVNKTTFENSKVKVETNKNIQVKIADILTTYDNLIENNNKRIKLLEQMAENLYKEWLVRFRVPGYENLEFVGTLPIGWQYQPISESIDFFDSQRVPLSSMQRDEMEKIYPYYGAAKLMDYVDDYLFDGEYLLLGEDGTVVTTDGFPVLQLVNDKFWVNNHAHVIRGKGNISTRFLYLTFCRFPITGVVTGSAQPKISKGRLEKLKILVPDAITMEHFNNLINPMFDEINVLKKQLIRITKQRDLLLPRLMSGRLEV